LNPIIQPWFGVTLRPPASRFGETTSHSSGKGGAILRYESAFPFSRAYTSVYFLWLGAIECLPEA
jgi:hypothetical protein